MCPSIKGIHTLRRQFYTCVQHKNVLRIYNYSYMFPMCTFVKSQIQNKTQEGKKVESSQGQVPDKTCQISMRQMPP